jgi:hypothetical protein
VRELNVLLSNAADTYDRLERFVLLCEFVTREVAEFERLDKAQRYEERNNLDRTWYHLYFGSEYYRHHSDGTDVIVRPLGDVLTVVEPFATPLAIDAIRIESPGWVQLFGSLNPLKVVADFISRWRAENTKRMNIENTTCVERERIRTRASVDKDRIRSEFAREILRLMPPDSRGLSADRVSEVISYVIQPSLAALEAMGEDGRVLESQVVEAGIALPSTGSQRK